MRSTKCHGGLIFCYFYRNCYNFFAFIQPDKPTQNAYIEGLNGNIRQELLMTYVVKILNEVREKTQQWMHNYNHHPPHKSLGYKTPLELLT